MIEREGSLVILFSYTNCHPYVFLYTIKHLFSSSFLKCSRPVNLQIFCWAVSPLGTNWLPSDLSPMQWYIQKPVPYVWQGILEFTHDQRRGARTPSDNGYSGVWNYPRMKEICKQIRSAWNILFTILFSFVGLRISL